MTPHNTPGLYLLGYNTLCGYPGTHPSSISGYPGTRPSNTNNKVLGCIPEYHHNNNQIWYRGYLKIQTVLSKTLVKTSTLVGSEERHLRRVFRLEVGLSLVDGVSSYTRGPKNSWYEFVAFRSCIFCAFFYLILTRCSLSCALVGPHSYHTPA